MREVKAVTNEEKALLVQGTNFMYTRKIGEIKSVAMADGPHGVRKQIGGGDNGVAQSEPATAFPTAACIASSWNTENAYLMGETAGKECRYYGVNVLLGPGVNVKRSPLCGRNFEYYSEDPLLSGKMGAAFIRGVEKNGVSACVKHFAANNQENFRFTGSSWVDERALREIYLKPFEIAVKEGRPGAVMTAYNRINGVYASENTRFINDILRKEWNFDGIVMSDWGGTDDRVAGIHAGEDLEMPGDTAINIKRVKDALDGGTLKDNEIDACVARIEKFSAKYAKEACAEYTLDHTDLAVEIAVDSAVLMKNDGTLPLKRDKKYCIIGDLFEKMRYQGSGSSMIAPTRVISHRAAFEKRNIDFVYFKGYDSVAESENGLVDEALKGAENYGTVILFAGLTDLTESEAGDRENMCLPAGQEKLISALAGAKKKIVLVLFGGSPVEIPFEENIDAILNMYLPGQGGGEATAQLLFGEVSPSGKLAESWFEKYSDIPYSENYSKSENELYKESIFVGYRSKVKAKFPFGFGLTYTSFEYSCLGLVHENGKISAEFTIENTGDFLCGEVAQLYIRKNESALFRAEKELKGFLKVYLAPKESRRVKIEISESDLAYFNVKENRFTVESGEYTAEIAASSTDVRLKESFFVSGENAEFPYKKDINEKLIAGKPLSDEEFFAFINLAPPAIRPKRPITLQTRIADFKYTFGGKIIYFLMCLVPKHKLFSAKRLPKGEKRDNGIKGAIFMHRILDTNSIRTLAMSAGNILPWNLAEAVVELANGHFIRAVKKACTKIKY